jgi:hypothetical protein
MKATKAGQMIGKAMIDYDGDPSTVGKVLAFVSLSWGDPNSNNPLALAPNITQQPGSLQDQFASSGEALTVGVLSSATLNVGGNATIGGDLAVTGKLVTRDLQLSGHVITGGNVPKAELQPYAGLTKASEIVTHVAHATITGNDTTGKVTLNIGDLGAGVQPGDLVKVVFDRPFDKSPQVIVGSRDKQAAQLQPYVDLITGEYFTIAVAGVPEAGAVYTFTYYAVE